MVKDGDCVAVFHSVHRVLKAEQILKAATVDFRLIPAPRQISADCGLALTYPCEMQDLIRTLLAEADLNMAEVWIMRSGQYVTTTMDP